MVSTPELAIAKAALTASLSRADPTSLTRGAVNEILQFIDNTLDECSRPNVQKCKNWILSNVVHSTGRSATFGKYLVALSESMELDYDRPSVRRRRLHALYLVSDVLHHVVVRQGNRDFARAWDAQLPALVATASTFEKCPRHLSKVRDLITLWEQKGYLSADLIKKLRDSFTRASDKYSGTQIHMTPEALQLAKEAPYIMPSHHGDPSMSWNNLPAATWLAEMVPNSTIPMRKSMCRPVQLQAGVAKEGIIQVVKATLADADNIFHKKPFLEKVNYDFNLLGEVQRPSNSDDTVCPAETYWGWSREFCRSMKGRATRDSSAPQPPQSRRSRSVSQGVSRTSYRSRSRPSSKRPRYSSPSRSRSRSPRRSRSHTPGDYRSRYAHRDRRSRSPYSRSRSPAARRSRSGQRRSYSRPPSRSRSRSSSPSRSRQGHHQRYPHHGHRNGDGHPAPPPPAAPPAFHAMPAAPGQFPIPPPPPPPMGYQGVFPPPPPPPQGWTPNQPGFAPHMMGGWGQGHVPPPPPQPPMPYDGQQQHNGQWGRGSGRGGGGRGYRGRGRGGNGRGGYGYGY